MKTRGHKWRTYKDVNSKKHITICDSCGKYAGKSSEKCKNLK